MATYAIPEGYESIPQCAARLGVKHGQVARWIQNGKIPYIKLGKDSNSRWRVIPQGAQPKQTHIGHEGTTHYEGDRCPVEGA